MNNSDIRQRVIDIADAKLKRVSEDIVRDLQTHARKHQRTGEMARNITMRRGKTNRNSFIIDGGSRSNFSDNTYHPIHFFLHADGKKKLTQVLQDARRKLSR